MKTAYQLYMSEIENISPMSKEEEHRYFYLWKENGNKSARMAIYKANLRFVVSVAHKYINQGVDILDLISEGNFALDAAMERFDYKCSIKFISYAVWYIKQAMLELLAKQSRFVSITGTEAVQKATLDRMANKLAHKLKREPTEFEKADNVGFSVEKVRHMELMLKNHSSISLDAELCGEKKHMVLQDVIPDGNTKSPDEIQDKTEIILKFLKDADLSEKQINVLTSYYGIKRNPRTLEDIRSDYNHSRERMRQIKEEALKKLQSFTRKTKIFNHMNILDEVM